MSGMDAERWARVQEILADALEREAGARADFLAEACGGDDALRVEVESLLSASAEADAFFDDLADRARDGGHHGRDERAARPAMARAAPRARRLAAAHAPRRADAHRPRPEGRAQGPRGPPGRPPASDAIARSAAAPPPRPRPPAPAP